MLRRRLLAPGIAAAVVLSSAMLTSDPAAAADVAKRLPLGTVSDIVVDPAAGLVFVSGRYNNFIDDGSGGGVVAVNLDGTGAKKITDHADTAGLAVGGDGSVYAAEDSGDIIAIDPTDLTKPTKAFDVGPADCPDSLAAVGPMIWFSYGCRPNTASGLGVLDPATGTVTTGILSGTRSARSVLAAVPGHPDQLLASDAAAGDPADPGSAPTDQDLSLLTVTDTTASVSSTVKVDNVYDLAVSPDGSTVVNADGSYGRSYDLPSLTTGDRIYRPTRYGATGVAYSPDGHYVAASVGVAGDPDTVSTYGPDSASIVHTYDTSTPGSANVGQTTIPAPHALAWAGHRLFAVYVDYGSAYPTLKVLNSATQNVTALSMTAPRSATRTHALHLSGRLTAHGAGLANTRVTIVRKDAAGEHRLPAATTTSTGGYALTDHPSVGGPVRYTVSYAGDATHAPSSRSATVAVSRSTASLSLKLDHAHYAYGQRAAVTVHLGRTFNGRTVALYAGPYQGRRAKIGTGKVDKHGNLTTHYRLLVRTKFTAVFAGDYHYAPRSVATTMTVAAHVASSMAKASGHSGRYALYRSSKGAGLAGGVTPNKQGECLTFRLEKNTGSGWHSVATGCFELDQNSIAVGYSYGQTGTPYRTRVEFTGDHANTKVNGKWYYIEFT